MVKMGFLQQNHTMSDYKEAGVDIDAAMHAVDLMKSAVRATYTPQVLADVGSFGGLFALENLPQDPVLVSSIDGVGTKVKLAAQLGRWRGIGHDIVNHCVNDILVQNARPLFFLDYVATSKLVPEAVAEVVTGIAEACQAVGCALIGGETAEMPGVYTDGAFDVAGTVVGLVDRTAILPKPEIMQAGDVLIGLPSSGPHTNGYSLIRRLVDGLDLDAKLADGQTLVDALLATHRCYLADVNALRDAGITLKGMAHITGGGFVDNLPRILPDHLVAQIDLRGTGANGQPIMPPIFQHLLARSEMGMDEAMRVFNLGIGMVLVVGAEAASGVSAVLVDSVELGTLRQKGDSSQPSVSCFGDLG